MVSGSFLLLRFVWLVAACCYCNLCGKWQLVAIAICVVGGSLLLLQFVCYYWQFLAIAICVVGVVGGSFLLMLLRFVW